MNGVQRIGEERYRQKTEEGWTDEHDDQWQDDELARAAASYALPNGCLDDRAYFWPWDEAEFKLSDHDRVRGLEKAGALIAAEIDRLQRAET